METLDYLILGNSAAAMGAIEGIRGVDAERPITLIAREPEHVYSRPLISYFLGGLVSSERMFYRPKDFYVKSGVSPRLGTAVARVDPDAHQVETEDGESFRFERLLIAVGGKPIMPSDLPGSEARGVFTFTTWRDARDIRTYIRENHVERAVVVGGGLIGLKSVEALHALGIRTTVLELADRILSATFGRTASALAQSSLEAAGVEVRCADTVTAVEQAGGDVSAVMTRCGERLPCSLLIFAIGVQPAIDIVMGTRIKTDRGILVDDHLETSVEGIYAAGDVAQAKELLTGRRRTIPVFPNAYRQGFIAGNNMAGNERAYEGGLVMNAVDICGLPTISVGMTDPEGDDSEVLSVFNETKSSYKKLVVKDGRIVGAIFLGKIDRAGIITGLIKDKVNVAGFKHLLLNDEFGLISLPADYRKHMVSGVGIEV